MGCASSTPTPHASPSPHDNHTGENGNTEGEDYPENVVARKVLKINNYVDSEIKPERVLPLCDNLDQPLDVKTKHNGSVLPLPLDDIGIEDFENREQLNLNKLKEIDDPPKIEKLVNDMSKVEEISQIDQDNQSKDYKKLEEVVDDVVKMSDVPDDEAHMESAIKEQSNTNVPLDVTPIEIQDLIDELEAAEEEVLSASSEGRATRWEALADIAAELPPSLTVDPLTGQIYVLNK